LGVCVCVCVWVCGCVGVCMCGCACVGVGVGVWVSFAVCRLCTEPLLIACVHQTSAGLARVCSCAHVYLCACVSVCLCVCVCVCVCISACACVLVCLCLCLCMFLCISALPPSLPPSLPSPLPLPPSLSRLVLVDVGDVSVLAREIAAAVRLARQELAGERRGQGWGRGGSFVPGIFSLEGEGKGVGCQMGGEGDDAREKEREMVEMVERERDSVEGERDSVEGERDLVADCVRSLWDSERMCRDELAFYRRLLSAH